MERGGHQRPEIEEIMKDIPLQDNEPTCTVRIGSDIPTEVQQLLIQLLKKYEDMFAFGLD